MSVVRHRIKRGAYHDSVVLLQMQRRLAALDGIEQAGVVMATAANLELLAETGLSAPGADARPDDLLIVVQGATEAAARQALDAFDGLMAERRTAAVGDYRPKSLATALALLPEADWVAVSVPGEHAAEVARQALEADRHVFLYSDNVPIEEEIELKALAGERRRWLLGPDCGTVMLGGIGLGFANRVRRGAIGVVAASGTGLQTVACSVHAKDAGISHGVGIGGRDLSQAVDGATALRALDALAADDATEVIVVVSKPPHASVASKLLARAAAVGKPVVVHFQGAAPPGRRLGRLHFAVDLEDAAATAVALLDGPPAAPVPSAARGVVRGLFSGGTLAQEAVQRLTPILPELATNLHHRGAERWVDLDHGAGHVVLDLGADQFTIGRPHPMIDPQIVGEHLEHCASDPDVAVVVLDVVLGDGAHPDPAAALAPAVRAARERRDDLDVVALLVGTDVDPQEIDGQREALTEAGAEVVAAMDRALDRVLARCLPSAEPMEEADVLEAPRGVINVGVELFHDSLVEQEVAVQQVDWRPPAGGNEKLANLLQRLRQTG